MNGMLLVLAWVWPLALAAVAWRGALRWAPAAGALPALAAAVLVPVGASLDIPWLLLGARLGLDAPGRAFLLFTSLLWSAAGIYTADGFRNGATTGRFRTFFLLAMAGNLWLIVAQDLASFYAGFALMGLSSYGLVVHYGDPAALRAGRVYLAMTLVAEVSLFMALVLITHHAGLTPAPEDLAGLSGWAVGLALFGLAIKAGLMPLHVWLPLAHPAAPVPASAVLSGTMIKVALLGWLRFLPVGQTALPEWGQLLAGAGTATLLLALPLGMTQSDPKVVLAYSSVSKMGLIAVGLGIVLIEPALAPLGTAALLLYAGHHALVKGGLFLGLGLRKEATARRWVLPGLALLALALAGAPFTGGAVAKHALAPLLARADWFWLPAAASVGTVGATMLMARFLWIAGQGGTHPQGRLHWAALAWLGLLALVLLFPFVLGTPGGWAVNALPVTLGLAAAGAFAVAALRRPPLRDALVGLVPPGDLVQLGGPLAAAGHRAAVLWRRAWRSAQARLAEGAQAAAARLSRSAPDPERALRGWPTAGLLWLGISAALLLALSRPTDWLRPQVLPPGGLELAGPAQNAEPAEARRPAPAEKSEAVVLPTDREGRPSAEEGFVSTREAPLAPGEEAAHPESRPESAAVEEETRIAEATPAPPPEAKPSQPPRHAAAPPAPVGAEVAEPARQALATACPPAPYIFRQGGETLELVRCETDAAGTPRMRAAPHLTNRLVLLLQRALKEAGFNPGPADGLIGPRTRAAVRRFQESAGMRATGGITFELLDRLQQRLGPPAGR